MKILFEFWRIFFYFFGFFLLKILLASYTSIITVLYFDNFKVVVFSKADWLIDSSSLKVSIRGISIHQSMNFFILIWKFLQHYKIINFYNLFLFIILAY